MIDNPANVAKLMLQMEEHLPIPATPTSATVRQLRAQGLKISAERVLFIQQVFYLGDDGGIMCDITPAKAAKTPTIISLTHLRVAPSHPLSKEIHAYQQQRIRRIARSSR
jgi:hypothetical protein